MPEISNLELDDFCGRLAEFKESLQPAQQELLDKILKFAWNATKCEAHIADGFAGSFTPEQASLLLDYPADADADAPAVHLVPRMIKGFIR
ncbi:hypothetical protein VA596_13375 [Amycolatopsis sp., V23-08]|uniref:Uncharacterized protein n=1 Tax=Amycolatopsis heterodermiae TaxID=3110235 RepID=A0ABU5R2W8_9PSEU|nr:hypothetical protein [Amycolatopsis sp., V23-08]MEA5360532.1 hypothetical protein [Amycolatopsis sp., V23-08]